MFTIALKISCKRGFFGKNMLSVLKKANNEEFVSDSDDHSESVDRLNTCCNWVIIIGVLAFIIMYISYVFNLFETVPVNPLKY